MFFALSLSIMATNHNKRLKQRFGKKNNSHQHHSKTGVVVESSKNEDGHSTKHKGIYYNYYKQLMIIPFLILLASFVIIGLQIAQHGDFINKGISLAGGTSITLTKDMTDLSSINPGDLESRLRSELPGHDFIVRTHKQLSDLVSVELETDITDDENLALFKQAVVNNVQGISLEDLDQNVKKSGSTLGANFFSQIMKALIIAFILMGIVVFMRFKVPTPSLAVILAAFSDIVVTLAIVDLIGFKLSIAGIAAFLMLIGYSVDTDILLSTRVLKNKEGTVYSRIISALKTGLTMNMTTLAAVGVALLLSQSQTITQIMTILFIGLLVDMMNTWIQNAGILRWYAEKKEKENKKHAHSVHNSTGVKA